MVTLLSYSCLFYSPSSIFTSLVFFTFFTLWSTSLRKKIVSFESRTLLLSKVNCVFQTTFHQFESKTLMLPYPFFHWCYKLQVWSFHFLLVELSCYTGTFLFCCWYNIFEDFGDYTSLCLNQRPLHQRMPFGVWSKTPLT